MHDNRDGLWQWHGRSAPVSAIEGRQKRGKSSEGFFVRKLSKYKVNNLLAAHILSREHIMIQPNRENLQSSFNQNVVTWKCAMENGKEKKSKKEKIRRKCS